MPIKKYYTINEIIKWGLTSLSRRMITIKIKKLKVIYPDLIKGGKQGRIYEIHYSLLSEISARKNTIKSENIKTRDDKSRLKISEILYWKTNWTFFFMINPEDESLDYKTIIDEIPQSSYSRLFYGAHYTPHSNRENIHFHFLIKTDLNRDVLFNILKSNIKINVAPIRLVRFREDLRKQCFSYLKRNRIKIFNDPPQNNYYYGIYHGTQG